MKHFIVLKTDFKIYEREKSWKSFNSLATNTTKINGLGSCIINEDLKLGDKILQSKVSLRKAFLKTTTGFNKSV